MVRETSSFTARGGRWVLAQALLMAAVLVAGPVTGHLPESGIAITAAAILMLAGAVVGVAGVQALGHNRTVYPMPLANARLVQHGIYGIMRHPLYASLMSLSFGWSLLWTSWTTLSLALALTVLLHLKARREEAFLRCQFPGYESYAQRVKRFVPGVW